MLKRGINLLIGECNMRIPVLLAHFFTLIGALELFIKSVFCFSLFAVIFGNESFVQRLLYCFVGVAGVIELCFAIIFKPYKRI